MTKVKLFVATALGLFLSTTASAADYGAAHMESPDQYQLLFQNDHVMVLKMVLQPGEEDLPHHHNNETVYFQKGGTLRITEVDGKSFEANVPDGHVMWHHAWSHQVTNVGDTEVIAIIVEER